MAYRFNGSSDYVEFAISPFIGYTFGACTMAALIKRNSLLTTQLIHAIADSTLATGRSDLRFMSTDNTPRMSFTSSIPGLGVALSSTSLWYLLVATYSGSGSGGGTQPRFHLHDGTSWSHGGSGAGTPFTPPTIGGTDRHRVGVRSASSFFSGDIVCIGIKKSDSADATVETLTPTAFSTWLTFGFDWLVGFDTSLQSGGVLQNQAAPGTGDQTAISGTSVVSDPPGWSWARFGSNVWQFVGPGYNDFLLPVNATATTISVQVQRDSNYSPPPGGTLPALQILANGRLGISAQTVVDTGSAGGWNTLTSAQFTPSGTGWVTVRIASYDGTGSSVVAFDTVTVT
jgi:hypothetical protein